MAATLFPASSSKAGGALRGALLAVLLVVSPQMLALRPAAAQELSQGGYYWYVPEHEKYDRTTFYAQPNFNSGTVRVNHMQRFKLAGGQKGWVLLEFDQAGQAFIHLRILRNAAYDPAASDPWYEFKRASVFAEEPSKLEARLKGRATQAPQVTNTKTPAWKRYKDGWNLKPSQSAPIAGDDGESAASSSTTRPPLEKKPRNKYSLLPPIGSEPPAQETSESPGPSGDAPSR